MLAEEELGVAVLAEGAVVDDGVAVLVDVPTEAGASTLRDGRFADE